MKKTNLMSFIDYLELTINHPENLAKDKQYRKRGIVITVGDRSTRLALNADTYNVLLDELKALAVPGQNKAITRNRAFRLLPGKSLFSIWCSCAGRGASGNRQPRRGC